MQANFVWADIYRHQDNNGNISYSDQASPTSTLVLSVQKTYRYKHTVKRVYDGDTVILENGKRVRLLGLNTPEIESHYRQGQAGGIDAKEWLKEKLTSSTVFLEYDKQQKDKYGRLLAHVFLEDGEHVNQQLIKLGLATLSIIPPNLRYSVELQQAELMAENKRVGIWSMTEYQPIAVEVLPNNKTRSSWQRILAKPTALKESRKYIRLILNDKVDIRIAKQNLALFPELEGYIGKSLEIRGWASRSKDHYSILIRHPSAIISR